MKKLFKKNLNFQKRYLLAYLFGIYLIITAFILDKPSNIFLGMERIILSPDNLITDYIEVGGLGAAFFNSGLLTIISVILIHRTGAVLNGPLLAAIFTVSGFSFFGKNIFNSIPITLGVFLYSKFERTDFKNYLIPALFGSALGPLVGEIAFGFDLPIVKAIFFSYIAGITVGFILPPLSQAFLRFHQGYNLYNVGFTAGIIGMFATAVLKMFGRDVVTVNIISSGNNKIISIILFIAFIVILVAGYLLNNRNFHGYSTILNNSGQIMADFVAIANFPLVLINMGIMGIIGTSYILFIGGELTGPTIGGILTICGFAGFGKHPKNTIPILIGVQLATFLNEYDKLSAGSLLAALFGTTLAPIAGKYGPLAGIFAGFCHTALVANVGYLHGGMNLYNNGFSGGFVAATLVPIFDAIVSALGRRKEFNEKQ